MKNKNMNITDKKEIYLTIYVLSTEDYASNQVLELIKNGNEYRVELYNRETKELISADGVDFYVPTTMSKCISDIKDSKGNQQPALICEKLSTSAGLNLFKVSKQIKDAY